MESTRPVLLQDRFAINPMYLFRWEDSQEAHVLLYPEGVVKLNQTAAAILSYCTGDLTVDESIDRLLVDFDQSDRTTIAPSVMKFLEASRDKGWIRIND